MRYPEKHKLTKEVQAAIETYVDGLWGRKSEAALESFMKNKGGGHEMLDALAHRQFQQSGELATIKKASLKPHRIPWLQYMLDHVGEAEIVGAVNNPWIVGLWTTIGITWTHTDDIDHKVSWCAASVGASLEVSGIRSTRSGMARSYMTYGTPCGFVPGALLVFPRGMPPSGHVCVLKLKLPSGKGLTVDGNVSNKQKICKRDLSEAIACRKPPGWIERDGVLLPKPV